MASEVQINSMYKTFFTYNSYMCLCNTGLLTLWKLFILKSPIFFKITFSLSQRHLIYTLFIFTTKLIVLV